MKFKFRRFQTRLLLLFLVPLIAVLSSVYFAVNTANTRNAFNLITSDLRQSLTNFENAIADRNLTLAIAGDSLSEDFAFKSAYNTHDLPTILSATENLMARLVLADLISFVDEKTGLIVSNTLVTGTEGQVPPWIGLIEQARELDRQGEYPEAADIIVLEGKPYLVTVLPFFTPDLNDWVTLGFEIGQEFTTDFKKTVSAEVSVLFKDGENWHVSGSTLPDAKAQALSSKFNSMLNGGLNAIVELDAEEYVTLANPLSDNMHSVDVVMQRSLTSELQPFEDLKIILLQIFALGLVVIAGAALVISRNVTSPVQLLVQGTRRIAEGRYDQEVYIPLEDEIGELASAFNKMAHGLAEKEKVRDLLGKVVSPQIADELMSKVLELGGEEREVTILFSDVRGFTSLCEGQSPKAILSLLNEYFSAITTVIEQEGGVVDKYIGDAVMALFGAPLTYPDAPSRAIRSALAMFTALDEINRSFAQRNLGAINIGIGINSDRVVVGNMGSQTRLNYTAIGDGVNLASRLESLTKRYGAKILVSAQTAQLAKEFLYMELDRVRVKGKEEPVTILEPLMLLEQADQDMLRGVSLFGDFLAWYYAGDFEQAHKTFQHLQHIYPNHPVCKEVLTELYQQRLHKLLHTPPTHWDGVHTFTDK